jgi:CubicO group peptidase (beta-lactamase class C family)
VLLAVAITALPSAAAARPATPDFAAIDAYVQSEMAAIGLPGVAFGIVQRDQIIHLRGLGVADPTGRAVTPQTPFLIGSMAKSFTALAIMQLVEAGRVELDAPVQRYLPWFRVADAGASAQITVRHLLNQTSGLPTAPGLEYLVRKDTSDGALERDVRAIQNVALSYPPGQVYQYCNLNFSTLGLIVQTVAGQPYEEYVQQHILAPLGMLNSFASPEDAQRNGLATGYQFWFGRPVPSSLSYNRAAIPAGYISASAEDMARYAIAQLNGGRYDGAAILSPAGIAELHRPAAAAENPFSFYSDSRYAMGWVASQTNGVPSVWHNGDLLDFHAHVILVPDGQWGIVLLTNGQNELQGARIERIGVGVMSLLVGREPPPIENSLLMTILVVGLGACVLQILGIARSMVLLRRWRTTPARRPRGAVGVVLRVGLPLALSLLWALVTLLIVPQVLETPLTLLVYNDYSLVVVLSGIVGLVWGILRAVLAFLVLRTTSARQATAALARAPSTSR